jgi:uncharacterized membrane protein YqgA involved in biofilm formation
MFILGSLVNAGAILLGTAIGLLAPKMPERMRNTTMQGLSLAVILIGLDMALRDSQDILIIIVSMVLGGLLGEWLNIEEGLLRLGRMFEERTRHLQTGQVAEAFVTASLVFCVGAMAIVGAIQSGIDGSQRILYAKSLLDMVSAIVFATTLGVGVALSALPVLLYEGAIATVSHFAGSVLQNDAVIGCMSAAGGLLILGIGINLLGIKKVNVGNLLPAMFVAPILKWATTSFATAVHL